MNSLLRFALPLAGAALTLAAQSSERPSKVIAPVFRGVLLDAGCRDFSSHNLSKAPARVTNDGSIENNTARTASGVTVDAQALAAQRADVLPHQVADLLSRQSDPTCAIKGNTRAYALLLENGRLLDLDDGGNTYATAAVEGSTEGRAMLTGQAPGFKPRAIVKGRLQGDKILATSVQLP